MYDLVLLKLLIFDMHSGGVGKGSWYNHSIQTAKCYQFVEHVESFGIWVNDVTWQGYAVEVFLL